MLQASTACPMFVAAHKLFWAGRVQGVFEAAAMVCCGPRCSGRWKLYVDVRFNGNSCVRDD